MLAKCGIVFGHTYLIDDDWPCADGRVLKIHIPEIPLIIIYIRT